MFGRQLPEASVDRDETKADRGNARKRSAEPCRRQRGRQTAAARAGAADAQAAIWLETGACSVAQVGRAAADGVGTRVRTTDAGIRTHCVAQHTQDIVAEAEFVAVCVDETVVKAVDNTLVITVIIAVIE